MTSRRVLALDTTGHGGSVAVACEGRVLAREDHDLAAGYAEEVFTLADRALERAGVARADLAAVAVVSGPGSFTGLRIGVVTAKMIAVAAGLELWVAPTLDLVASSGGSDVAAACDAGRGHLWWREPGATAPIERLSLDDAAVRVRAGRGLAVREASNLAELERRLGSTGSLVAAGPLAELLAVAVSLGLPPARRVDPVDLVPEYGGVSQAERAHGLDLTEQVHRPVDPTPWT